MYNEDLQPSSLDDVLAAVLEKGREHSVPPLLLSNKSVPGIFAENIIVKAMKDGHPIHLTQM